MWFDSTDWHVEKNFLTAQETAALLTDAKTRHTRGEFRSAGIGRNQDNTLNPEVRTDLTCWWDDAALSPPQSALWQKLLALQSELNQKHFLNLTRIEAHYAVYEPGSFYRKHLDAFRGGSSNRRVSLVLYLNPQWSPEDGGELVLYSSSSDPAQELARVLPQGGTLATFLSEVVPHEVLPAHRQRWSIAVWMS